jgi:glycosyltransferase involved in cell wall biosynthesis
VVGAFLAAASVRVDLHLVLLAGFTAIGRPSTARTHDYRRRVWARARALAGRITIVDRPLSDVDVASLLASADAAVSIPASDQRSTSVLEALSCGLPVLATDIEPYRELRADGYAMDLIGEPIEPSLIAAMVRVVPSTARARARASQPVIAAEDRRVQFASMERAVKGVADRHGPG